MRSALFLTLLLAAPAARADSSACAARWLDQYETDWGFPRARWNDACERGLDPADALRDEQSAFGAACRARFAKPDAAGKVPPGEAEALCATGRRGRSRLYAMAGLPDEDAPKPAAPAGQSLADRIPPPGIPNMGPLMAALKEARATWHPDACFAALYYKYALSWYADAREFQRAHDMHDHVRYTRLSLNGYNYFFLSGEVPHGAYRVSYGDKMDAILCTDLDRMRGPDKDGVPPTPTLGGCLRSVDVDLDRALAAVFPKGAPSEDLEAYLTVVPASFLDDSRCAVAAEGREKSIPCAQARGYDAKRLARALGREMWVVAHGDRTYFVDARSGRVAATAPGLLKPALDESIFYAHGCGKYPAVR